MAQNNAKKQDIPQQPPQPPQMIKCGVVPQETLLQILDFLRDVPAPRKQTDPLVAGLQNAQYAEFPIGIAPNGQQQ